MGRFGIGARVRDWAGDEATIIGKRKGERQVRYDNPMYCQDGWFDKSSFTPIDDAPAAAPATEWGPKVGDRVKGTQSLIEYDVDAVNSDGTIDVSCLGMLTGMTLRYTNKSLSLFEPLPVAKQPAGLWAPVVGKYGKTRDGRKVGPITTRTEDGKTYFIADGFHYNASGECGYEGVRTPEEDYGRLQHDLVAEWVDEPAVPKGALYIDDKPIGEITSLELPEATTDEVAVKVKVGDKVWDGEGGNIYGGTVRTVAENGEFQIDYFDGITGTVTWTLDEWDHHEPAPIATPEPAAPPAKFKVGDRVNYTLARDCWQGVVIEEIRGDIYHGRVDGRGARGGFYADWLEPAPAPSAATPAESFIVARLTPSGLPRPSARPRVHTSLVAAENEAQRLADRLGDEFAVYQRVSSKTVDAGPVPGKDNWLFDAALAKEWIANRGGEPRAGMAFSWGRTSQGFEFWSRQNGSLTPSGRAILRKWIAEVESSTDKVAA